MARYQDAIQWIADNDDTEWAHDPGSAESVTAALVADLFGMSDARVREDILGALARADKRKGAKGP